MERETIVVGIKDLKERTKVIEALQNRRHTVIGSFGSPEELIDIISRFDRITVGIVEAEMPKVQDGEYAGDLLRKWYPGTKIVSYAIRQQTWGDDNIQKPDPDTNKLLSAVVKL